MANYVDTHSDWINVSSTQLHKYKKNKDHLQSTYRGGALRSNVDKQIAITKRHTLVYAAKRHTYMCYLHDSHLIMDHLHELMNSYNWTQIDAPLEDQNKTMYVDFLWIDYVHKRPLVDNITCAFKNNLSDTKDILIVKDKLHSALQKEYPELSKQHLPRTRDIQDIEKIYDGEILIIRPSGRGFFAGIGITVVTNNDELKMEKEKNKDEMIYAGRKMRHVIRIASTYIKDPLLWNGLKTHVRMYMLINMFPKYQCKMFHTGRIMTAKLPYISSDFHNKLIHDTHMGSTPKNLFFPKDYSSLLNEQELSHISKQCAEVVEVLGKLYEPYAKPYPESKTAFEIFAIDFIVNSSLNVFLLEVNDKVGYGIAGGVLDDAFKKFSYDYFDWTFHNAIEPLIEHIDKLQIE